MIAVPVITAVSTDAAIDKVEAGYRIDLTDPADEQLDAVKVSKDTAQRSRPSTVSYPM